MDFKKNFYKMALVSMKCTTIDFKDFYGKFPEKPGKTNSNNPTTQQRVLKFISGQTPLL